VAVGLFANSLALLSDAGHMLSDVAALLLAVLALRFARSNPGGSFTFGLRRLPVLGAFGNAFSLLAIVAIIFWEAGQRLVAPAPVLGWPVLGAGVVGLLVNGVSAWLLLRSGDGSLNVRGAVLHLLADALGSLGAILSAAVLLLTGWAAIDPLISVVIGLLILFGTLPVLRDSLKVLLQAAPARLDLDRLRQLLVAEEAVLRVEDLHVWELDSGQVVLTVRLICDPARGGLAELQDAADRLRERLAQEQGIGHATFEWRSSGGLPLGCGHGSG
jgi:cobalt-zinc-cadmium efflux system protein